MLKYDNTIQKRVDVERYALSVIKPLLESINPIWNPENPPKGKPHWMNHFFTYIEAVARPTWVLPFILNNTKKEINIRYNRKKINIIDWYKIALLSGTHPKLNSYWGEYYKYGQICTEVAPLALMLFFAKKKIWNTFSAKEKKQISTWLYKIADLTPIKTHRNNHYWFPIFINLALKKLGLKYHKDIITNNLKKLDQFYMGKGWYYDGTIGRYDYYIPWSHHYYPMLWILLENEDYPDYKKLKEKYINRTNEFLKYYVYFFDENGLQIPFGRSLSYRFAASGLFPLAYYNGCEIDAGVAKNINLSNLNIFKNHGAPSGEITKPGFTYNTEQVVERYISSSSSYWFVKGFISLLMDSNHSFWKSKISKMPIQNKPFVYNLDVKNVNLLLEGNKKNGVTLYNNSCYVKIGGFGSTNEMYGKFAYNSRSGFGLSSKDIVSIDNMISLMTEQMFVNRQLVSHRGIFLDLGKQDDVFYSQHIPFPNDENSIIKTALLPLNNGMHIRIHKVTLSQPYYIAEGGFSVGRRNDEQKILKGDKWISLTTEAGHSFLYSFIPENISFETRKILPNFHILYPLAAYPIYITKEKLKKGTYYFASLFLYEENSKITQKDIMDKIVQLPQIIIKNKKFKVIESKTEYKISL